MSSSDQRVRLTVKAADAATEIFVIDGGYRLVGRGLGSMTQELPAGLYKVKVRSGQAMREEFARLEPGNEMLMGDSSGATLERHPDGVEICFPKVPFPTAAPLMDTGRTHEYQLAAAAHHSRQVHVTYGRGSQVFLFARSWTHEWDEAGSDWSMPGEWVEGRPPLPELTLRDSSGHVLVDLGQDGARDLDAGDPWIACNAEVDPGVYRLRLSMSDLGTLERIVVAPPGWQAQVFAYQRFDKGYLPHARGLPNLSCSSALLRRLGRGFNPANQDLRLTELARSGLRNQRAVIPPAMLDQLLQAKFDNPMLGIFGGHLLLLGREPDLGLLERLVAHLRGMLGPHPDVEALGLVLGHVPDPDYAWILQYPPMLLRSWSIIVRATMSRPELVPPNSLAARVADRLWGDGPTLTWRGEESEPAHAPPVQAAPMNAPPVMDELLPAGQPPGALTPLDELLLRLWSFGPERLARFRELDGVEGMLATFLDRTQPAAPLRRRRRRAEPSSDALVAALGMPVASIEEAARRLLSRLSSPQD